MRTNTVAFLRRHWAFAMGVLVPPAMVAGQSGSTYYIRGSAGCVSCTVQASLSVVLRGTGDLDLFNPPHSGFVDSKGRVVVARGGDGPPVVADASGQIRQALGRTGDGPGEYRSAEIVLSGGGDSIVVIDRRGQRFAVHGPDGNFVRSAPLPDGVYSAAWTSNGYLVTYARLHDPERFGTPYHVFDRVGNHIRSFGPSDMPIVPGRTPPQRRRLARASGGGIWSISTAGEYRIERWSIDGTRSLSLIREADWFPSEVVPRGFARTHPPSPQVFSIVETNGYLWVAVRVPDEDWRSAVRWRDLSANTEAARIPLIDSLDGAFDTVIEVFDIRERTLVASARFDRNWIRFAGPGKLVAFRTTGDSTVTEIHDVRLVRGRNIGLDRHEPGRSPLSTERYRPLTHSMRKP